MKKVRSPLKYAGNKYGIVEKIIEALPEADRLVDVFAGSSVLFLNADYDEYVINDINTDITSIFQALKDNPQQYIQDVRKLFNATTNNPDAYYALRREFNNCTVQYERAVIFLYMNRHGYNGLSRYSLKSGFNVPFGHYKKPYFPEEELSFFADRMQTKKVTITNESFEEVFKKPNGKSSTTYYCDPPFLASSNGASFAHYAKGGFSLEDQLTLAELAFKANSPVIISNHDTAQSREIYSKASQITSFDVKRTISCKTGERKPVKEILAIM